MSNRIVWKMNVEVAERYFDLVRELENHTKTEEEFAEALMSLPGYPLSDIPGPGEELTIEVTEREWAKVGSAKRTIH